MPDSERSLTAMAEQLRDRKNAFQRRMTDAASRVLSDPDGALHELLFCERETQSLQQDEHHFLERLGVTEAQRDQATQAWNTDRLQILLGKANAYLLLGQFVEARAAVGAARQFEAAGASNLGKAMLDTLEAQISAAEN
jgi:FtsZ-binding cell division protein ZapB